MMTGSPDELAVLTAVVLPFVAAAFVPVLHRALGERTGYAGAGVAALCFLLLGSQHGTAGTVSVGWVPALDVALRFHVDAWGLLFALLASGMGVLVFAYSVEYMHGESGLVRYYLALLAFMGSVVGVALAADLIALFLFWELTSLCSFLLIGYHTTDPESRYAARMAMLVTVGGGLFFLVGLLLLRIASGVALESATFDLSLMLQNPDAMEAALRETGLFVPALLLVAVGAGAKSAQVPLHFWLPNAMAAPTPVSAFLHSATMVKVGVYFIGRLRPLLASPEWMLLFTTVGLATMTITAVLAVGATDVKELLAYSTASHLGLMVAGFGFRSAAGAGAGVFHLLNHALFKAALFLVAGIVAHEAGTRRMDELGGLWRELPITAVVTAIATLSMAGVPPFNGFYSKELLFEAAYEAGHAAGGLGWLYPVVAVLASVFTVLYSLRFLALFFGARPTALDDVHRPPVGLLAPPTILVLLAAVVSVDPHLAERGIVGAGIAATGADAEAVHLGLPTYLSPPVAMSVVTLVIGGVAYLAYDAVHAGVRRTVDGLPPIRPNWWYDRVVAAGERLGGQVTTRIHNGLLRTYLVWLIGATGALALAGYAATGVELPGFGEPTLALSVALVLVVAVIAAVAVATAPSHVAGVLSLALLGLMIAIFFILASAPDLALTQLVVETLALLIFLLVIEELPEFYADVDWGRWLRDGVLSAFVGVAVFLTVVVSLPEQGADPTAIARFYTEQAVPGGGGTNVVNVILVDFRGFDTLGELVVIAMTALSVLTLVIMRTRGEAS